MIVEGDTQASNDIDTTRMEAPRQSKSKTATATSIAFTAVDVSSHNAKSLQDAGDFNDSGKCSNLDAMESTVNQTQSDKVGRNEPLFSSQWNAFYRFLFIQSFQLIRVDHRQCLKHRYVSKNWAE